ncbi:hypothetical protein EYF80_040060 [Liparis tanakae]|uniref:Uncharacterized protein n=1 Tax=Liparis tanakae TaxID=230148 RepID=A0A4Z2G8E2_9TELE|nr:hypothetical protein EYF80_040060 [Liparis tanakae]
MWLGGSADSNKKKHHDLATQTRYKRRCGSHANGPERTSSAQVQESMRRILRAEYGHCENCCLDATVAEEGATWEGLHMRRKRRSQCWTCAWAAAPRPRQPTEERCNGICPGEEAIIVVVTRAEPVDLINKSEASLVNKHYNNIVNGRRPSGEQMVAPSQTAAT